MSLIYSIKTRQMSDLINQGVRLALNGTVASAVTDGVIMAGANERNIVVTGWSLSSKSSTDVLVSLGFKVAGQDTGNFLSCYVRSGSPIAQIYQIGDERYGASAACLVITTDGNDVAYTVDGRLLADKVGLGYIQNTAITRL